MERLDVTERNSSAPSDSGISFGAVAARLDELRSDTARTLCLVAMEQMWSTRLT